MAFVLLCAAVVLTTAGCKQNNGPAVNAAGAGGSGGTGGAAAGRDGGTDASKDGGAHQDARTCPADAGRSKSKAEACACNSECQSGFCVDGVCCSSACGESCKACNLPNSLGDCALVPAGGKPTRGECSASAPATCGQDGTCDGKGACRKYVKGTECKTGTCDGDGVTGALACDGKGACTEPVFTACAPYTCDKAKNRCATRCTTDAQCSKSQTCVDGSCGRSSNGASCEKGGDCASGFCVDGVCCNVACSGACVSCNQTGSVGHCQYIAAGLPDSECNAQDRSTCGNTGLCDGQGTCTLYPANTVCAASSCSGLIENAPRTCDGKGVCRDAQLVDCAPFVCSSGACTTSCDPKSANTCESGHACVAPTSGSGDYVCGKRKNGQTCPDASQCESGFCVDGVCCESACTGACRSCNLAGSPGKCTNAAAGSADPRKTCTDKGAATCSTNGLCDGKGACQSYPEGSECGSASCTAGAYTPPATCNAAGQCAASRSRTCAPFVCNGSACYDACTNDKQCSEGNFCVNGSCGLKPQGANCNTGGDCKSGFCAQGVCCDRACTDTCMACNLSNSQGICTTVADGAADPQGKCQVTTANTCGTTGACLKGACAFHKQGTSCKAAACATTSSVKPAYTCDGAGKCVEPKVVSCGSFVCANAGCKTTCTLDADCVAPATCIAGSCGLKVDGAACTSGSQCQSGFCTEGVCCNTACADSATGGLCRTCKGVGTVPAGTCANVASGGADPKSRCVASKASEGDCSNDGTCDGAGACRHWSTSTACRQESCSDGIHTAAATCNPDGTCGDAQTNPCSPYTCADAVRCRATCSSPDQCVSTSTCLTATNRCGSKLTAGEACQADTDCNTGLKCSAEGVCCDQTCSGGCESCKLANQLGTCTAIGGGDSPRTSAMCPAAEAGSCGNTGKCDGAGGCELRTACTSAPTTCPTDKHTQYSSAGTCGANGTCSTSTETCGTGYLCTAGACATQCTASNEATACDVANGYACIDGSCAKRPNGAACTGDSQCSNGHCVNEICCATACGAGSVCAAGGVCKKNNGQTCELGSDCVSGNCVAGTCCGSSSCGDGQTCTSGTCKKNNGQGCELGSECSTGNCVSGTCCATSSCGAGQTCAPAGTCKEASGQACDLDTECALGHCVNHICCITSCNLGYVCAADGSCKKTQGQGCELGSECASNNCVSQVCCASASCAAGQTCAPGGSCKNVNGQGCQAGSECASNNCVNQVCCTSSTCAGYLCGAGGACTTDCTGIGCASGYYCSGSTCALLKVDGAGCGANEECVNGHCVGDVCCNSACEGGTCTGGTCTLPTP